MKICIIGGGVAGIQALKRFCEKYECHLFEKENDLGGVWVKNYDNYSLQVPAELYEFPGFPSKSPKSFTDGKDVQKYINSYIEFHKLYEKAYFYKNEKVLKAIFEDNKWNIITNKSEYSFDYCIVSTGMYNEPFIPENIINNNKVVHSSKFIDAKITKNKRVVVIGGGKSAIDCATEASKYANETILVMRELHWPVPRYILGCIPFKWGTYSRLGHFLLPKHWRLSKYEEKWHDFLLPIKNNIWKLLEIIFKWQFNLEQKPKVPLDVDLFNGGQILTYEFRNLLKDGKIKQIISENFECAENADLVIAGTGFSKSYDIFDDITLEKLKIEEDGLWLYKNILPPNIDRIAFIGSEVSTFNNILTQHIQVEWLAFHIENEIKLSKDVMEMYINKEKEWKRSWMKKTKSRSSLLQLHMTKYHDILCEDMNHDLVKKKWWQWILPHYASDYKF